MTELDILSSYVMTKKRLNQFIDVFCFANDAGCKALTMQGASDDAGAILEIADDGIFNAGYSVDCFGDICLVELPPGDKAVISGE